MAKNTVKIKKYSDVIEEYTLTAVAVTPGYFLEVTSAGVAQAHSTAGGNVFPLVALEDELQGDGIDGNIAASQKTQCWIPYRGDQVYAWLKDGETAVIGSTLESAGDGTLQVHTADSAGVVEYPNAIVGIALEAVDLSASSVTAKARIIVRIV